MIILGIILLVVIYFLYTSLFTGSTLASKIYLNGSNGSMSYDDMGSPGSSRFSFSLWVYIENLSNGGNSVIFEIPGSFQLYVSPDAHLKYSIGGGDNVITSNYPLQRWVHVVLSFDNSVIDSYLDGKLIRSQQLASTPQIGGPGKSISYGSGVEGYIAKFERLTQPMDPGTAWSKYMAGNGGGLAGTGGGGSGGGFSNYGGTFTLTKDSLDVSKVRLF